MAMYLIILNYDECGETVSEVYHAHGTDELIEMYTSFQDLPDTDRQPDSIDVYKAEDFNVDNLIHGTHK